MQLFVDIIEGTFKKERAWQNRAEGRTTALLNRQQCSVQVQFQAIACLLPIITYYRALKVLTATRTKRGVTQGETLGPSVTARQAFKLCR